MSEHDQIDMSRLTQRELLILLHQRVGVLESKIDKDEDLRVRVNTIETRHKIASGLWAAGSVLVTIIINLLKLK